MTIHRFTDDESLNVLDSEEHPLSSLVRAPARAIGFPVSLAEDSSAPYSLLRETPKRITMQVGTIRNIHAVYMFKSSERDRGATGA